MTKGAYDSGFTPWDFDVMNSTLDRSGTRVGTEPDRASSLVGVDGNWEGEAHVHPGFRRIHNLGTVGGSVGTSPTRETLGTQWDALVVAAIGGSSGAYHDRTSNVIDLHPITIYLADGGYLLAFIYRVQRKVDDTTSDIFMDWLPINVSGVTSEWQTPTLLKTDVLNTAGMDVEVFGRLGYVLAKGYAPLMLYPTLSGTTITINLVTPAGPGLTPEALLIEATTEFADETNRMFYSDLSTDNPLPEAIDSYGDLADPSDRSGYGRFWTGIGLTAAGSEQAQEPSEGIPLTAGGYGLAYRFLDTRSGRKSGLSDVVDVISSDFPVVDSANVEHPIGLAVAYDSARYDQVEVFRSVRVEDASGTYTGRILHPDRVLTLSEYDVTDTDLGFTAATEGRFDPRTDATTAEATRYFVEVTGGTNVTAATGDTLIFEVERKVSDTVLVTENIPQSVDGDQTDFTINNVYEAGVVVAVTGLAWTDATQTLAKSGAFAALFALYGAGVPSARVVVEVTGGTNTTPGWYEIATIVDADSVTTTNTIKASGTDETDIAIGSQVYDATGVTLTASWDDSENQLTATTDDFSDLADVAGAADTDWKASVYFYTLEDKPLTFKFPYVEDAFFDKTIPQASVGVMYDNTLVVSDIGNPAAPTGQEAVVGDEQRTSHDIRWSSLMDISPELFPPNNRYTPPQPGDVPIAMRELAGNVLAFAKDQIYHIRKEGAYIRVFPIHKGYGTAGRNTLEVVGNQIYFVNERGMKSVGPDGGLDDVRALNRLFTDEWQADLPQLSMGFDTGSSSLCVLNPVQGKIAMLWFNTGRVTEFWYVPFTLCRSGRWFREDDTSQVFEQRAMFVRNPVRPAATPGDTTAGGYFSVYVMDTERIKDPVNEQYNLLSTIAVRTLDWDGDNRVHTGFTDSNTVNSLIDTNTWDFNDSGGGVFALPDANEDLNGEYAWVTACADSTFLGKKGRIHSSTADTLTWLNDSSGDLNGLPIATTTRLAIGPVYFEWAGTPLGVRSSDGQIAGNSFRQIRHVDSIAPTFVNVSGQATTDGSTDATFTGLLFVGDERTPSYEGSPRSYSDGAVKAILDSEVVDPAMMGDTSTDGRRGGVEGNILTPGIRVVCTDLDFGLIWVAVEGRMKPYTRSNRKET